MMYYCNALHLKCSILSRTVDMGHSKASSSRSGDNFEERVERIIGQLVSIGERKYV